MIPIQPLLLVTTTLYQAISRWREDRQPPPVTRVDIGGQCLHCYILGEGGPTVVLDHSLGGVEGYLLIREIAKRSRVFIYDRAGYGWSDPSLEPRTSERIVRELDTLLMQAGIAPPYLLVGDSFGSYNVRLYAHRYPEKVAGMVLTDPLHEAGMLDMPWQLQGLKLFFMSGFVMSTLGAVLGIVRLLGKIGTFELLKPALRQCQPDALSAVKRSFFRPKHWLTMFREMLSLEASGCQLQVASSFGRLPIVLITASSFFKRSLLTAVLPIRAADKLREKMHDKILGLSDDCTQIHAEQSDHFVWVDRPEAILKAIDLIREKTNPEHPTPTND